eukprot:TRINITY_DN4640_c0_g1_i2.p1 TRINITY_DN4640_c0_g1~~TRINITY_DN4640_c0_g1_i2.p1  ORF type:complete len:421 (+),score=80.81 TRINITY_DN4640_c0_g1_i2:53-1315(+)
MVKEPPKEADCCGSGCLKCVWDTYYEQVEEEGFKEEVQERGIAKTAGPFEMPQNCVKVVGVEEEGECALGVLGLASVSVCEITQFGCLKSIMLESTLQDHISIFTPNPPEVVSRLMTRLNYTDRTIKVLPSTFSDGADAPTYPYWIPQNTPLSLVTILMYFSDLSSRASVRQPVLHILAAFASPDEATALKHLASSAGLSEYRQKYCSSGKHVSLLDVLEEYPSACPPVGRLLSALPQLKARFFSNAAVGSVGEVLVNTSRQGLSSGALKKLMKGDTVFLGGPTPNIPLTPFRSPTSADRCLLISAGVGVSPIMRVLRGMPPSSAWVYHGCRTAEDIPHQHTLQQAARFSPCLSSQGYIWKKLLQDKEDIVSFAPAAVYICGPALMMKNTVSALEEVLTEGRVKELKENGGWRVEKWGSQ